MAIFGRRTARQRLRRATQQSLTIPAFSTPTDCTPWVLGGLWPAELETVTAETATLAQYLKNDLQRIADSANEKLRGLRQAGLPEPLRQSEEARVMNVARAFAVLRVESTVRQLRKEALGFSAEYLSLSAAPQTDPNQRSRFDDTRVFVREEPDDGPQEVSQEQRASGPREALAADDEATGPGQENDNTECEPEVIERDSPRLPFTTDPVLIEPLDEVRVTRSAESVVEQEPDSQRLRRLVEFVARQEPGLRWAVGDREDGTTILVTDLAHGWIPSRIDLPAGVTLLPPARRGGKVSELLGEVVDSATYAPGDPFSSASEFDVTVSSQETRELPAVDDLGWKLGEATHWRDGLPRMVNTLAKAGAARTGVVDAEVDVLRVHLDTARYQLLAQYPDADQALLCNCLLLAATAAIATGDHTAANYHFAWFEALSTPPASHWGTKNA